MTRWFRSHASKLNSPKVQRLSDKLYRAWDSLLCVACEFDGVLPPVADTAFMLRKSEKETTALVDQLLDRGFFVKTERGIEPHDWNEWQYKSDVSTDRVQRFRKRQRNVSLSVTGNVPETPSESETDTETDSSVPNGTGGKPPDVATVIFGQGRQWLQSSTGKSDGECRKLLGRWRQKSGDEALIAALGRAQREGPIDAIAWMEAALRTSAPAGRTPMQI
jgi:hypothetical protein